MRSAAALLAAWRIRSAYGSVASRKRSICCSANAGSVVGASRGASSGRRPRPAAPAARESPQRPMPVSSFRWTRTPSGISPSQTASSSRGLARLGDLAARRGRAHARGSARARTRRAARAPRRRSRRRARPRPRPRAPPPRRARRGRSAFAFTTAHSSAPSSTRSERARVAAARRRGRSVSSDRCIGSSSGARRALCPTASRTQSSSSGSTNTARPSRPLELALREQRAEA